MGVIKKILTHEFVRNSSIIIIGSLIAQFINLLSPIIISRLFTPEHFGELALITSIIAIFGNIASHKFESTISVSQDKFHAAKILEYCFKLIKINFFILLLISLIIYLSNANFFNFSYHVFFIPVWVATYAYFFAIKAYLIKIEKFRRISVNSILRSIFTISSQGIAGLLISTSTSLITGKIVGEILTTISLINKKLITNYRNDLKQVSFDTVYNRYKKIAYWHIPIRLLDATSKNSVILIMTYCFNSSLVGLLSLAEKLIQLPANLIAENIQRVFEQRSVRYFKNQKDLRSYVYKVTLILFTLSIIPSFLLFFFSEQIITILLPSNWHQSAVFIKWLSPIIVGRFTLAPCYSVFKIKQRLNHLLLINSLEVVIKIIALFYVGLNFSAIVFTQYYVVISLIFMLITILKSYTLIK